MYKMSSYEQELMEKVDDLQQQARFCINNYDYHHRNNETAILNHKRKQLRSSARHVNRFWNNLNALEDAVQQAAVECGKVDELLIKYGIGKKVDEKQQKETLDGSNIEEDDTKSEKENI